MVLSFIRHEGDMRPSQGDANAPLAKLRGEIVGVESARRVEGDADDIALLVTSTGDTSSSMCRTVHSGGASAARYGMVICWKFSARDRRTLLIAGDEAVTSSSVRPRDMTANHIGLDCAGHAPASSPLRLGRPFTFEGGQLSRGHRRRSPRGPQSATAVEPPVASTSSEAPRSSAERPSRRKPATAPDRTQTPLPTHSPRMEPSDQRHSFAGRSKTRSRIQPPLAPRKSGSHIAERQNGR